ncbi:MAG: DNA-processing protein DprA, partial [Acidobacteriota bacterium]|nr:DNA-processing protein DprA [Acidobacteriota bacterium]
MTLASQEHERARRFGDRIVVHGDDDYPLCLDDLPLPPPVLYIVGTLPAEPAIAIVGSRSCDAYGRAVAELFARRLALAGLVVVSGLARGIDTVAHRAALDAAGGQTVGVLGCGIDVDYPRRSARLRGAIAERGALISEFPIGCSPQPRNFPIRNRI